MAVERHNEDAPLVMGRIAAPYGVKGWVRVATFTEAAENLLAYAPWHLKLNGRWQAVELLDGREHGKGLVVQLAGCDDRDAAAHELALPLPSWGRPAGGRTPRRCPGRPGPPLARGGGAFPR